MAVAIVFLAIAAVLLAHLTVALVVAMLVYVAGRQLADWLQRRSRLPHPAAWSVAILIALVAGPGTLAWEHLTEVAAPGTAMQKLLEQMATVLNQLRTTLPAWLSSQVPASLEALRAAAVPWLHDHAVQLRSWGQDTVRVAAYVLAGAVIGALAVIETRPAEPDRAPPTPWLDALTGRFRLFEQSFAAVVFAQLRIALVNTALTAIYVLAVLPALGTPLPMGLTLVAFTFVASLLPVIGNLISNTVIVIVSLTQGPGVAALSLGFLVAVHKLEYFLNARIVGSRIGTRAWELLAVMLLFEAVFGVAGLVMAPIVYAYAKAELRAAGWL